MEIDILFFGQLTDITRSNAIKIENPGSINRLREEVLELYPALRQSKFVIALNNKIIQDDAAIEPKSTIALMPPFSGV